MRATSAGTVVGCNGRGSLMGERWQAAWGCTLQNILHEQADARNATSICHPPPIETLQHSPPILTTHPAGACAAPPGPRCTAAACAPGAAACPAARWRWPSTPARSCHRSLCSGGGEGGWEVGDGEDQEGRCPSRKQQAPTSSSYTMPTHLPTKPPTHLRRCRCRRR